MNLGKAIFELYPSVVNIINNEAFDINGNKVEYDLTAVTNQANADQQAEATHKQNAIAKLTALGLTADEISALGV